MPDQSITILAAPGCKATIKVTEGSGSEYTVQRTKSDAVRLANALLKALPTLTFLHLARLLEIKARELEKKLAEKNEQHTTKKG